MAFSNLVLGDLLSKDKARLFYKNHPGTKHKIAIKSHGDSVALRRRPPGDVAEEQGPSAQESPSDD
jgi:hypothetical protein